MKKASLITSFYFLVTVVIAQISGPTSVIQGQSATYNVTVLSSNPSWTISPSYLFQGQGTHQITVSWQTAGTYTISFYDGPGLVDQHTVIVSSSSPGGSSPWTEANNEVYYTGNVGIGNTNPSYKLDVSGTARITSDLRLGSVMINDNANRSGLLEVTKTGSQTWSGVSVEHTSSSAWSLMGDQDDFGLYDDYNNEWILMYNENSSLDLYHNGSKKLNTTSTGINVSGEIITSNKIVVDGNTVIDDNAGWHRSYGSTGWYNGTHGGGIYMQDGTWIRTYGNKSFYHNTGTMRTDGTFQVGPGGDRFYVNTSGNSALSGNMAIGGTMTIGSDIKGHIAGGALRIRSTHGYVDIGPQNSSWSHFSTDRGRFYFNKGITVDQGLIGSYNENLQLQTSGTTRITVNNSSGNVGIGTAPNSNKLHVNGVISATNGNSNNWNTAYSERGSQIAGTGLTWSGGKLNATAQNPSLIITNTSQWNPDGDGAVLLYDDSNPTYNGKYVGAVIDIRGDGSQDAALVRTGAYHADHFQASRGFYIGSSETNGTRIIDASGNISASGTVTGSNLNISNWNTAYSQRGSQIAGSGLNWSGGKLNVTGVNTDDQVIDVFSLSGTTLSLSLESDGQATKTINLASLDTQLSEAEIITMGFIQSNGGNLDLSGVLTLGTPTLPTTPSGIMYVNGSAYFTDINVQANGSWPDYVFGKHYKLMSLEDTEQFIEENHHLPEVPSAEEVEKEGIDVAEMNKILLQKIEELTLHLIDQNKKIERLQQEVSELQKN